MPCAIVKYVSCNMASSLLIREAYLYYHFYPNFLILDRVCFSPLLESIGHRRVWRSIYLGLYNLVIV